MSTVTDHPAFPTPGDVIALAQPPASTGHYVPDVVVRVLDEHATGWTVQDVDATTFEVTGHPWRLALADVADLDTWDVVG